MAYQTGLLGRAEPLAMDMHTEKGVMVVRLLKQHFFQLVKKTSGDQKQ